MASPSMEEPLLEPEQPPELACGSLEDVALPHFDLRSPAVRPNNSIRRYSAGVPMPNIPSMFRALSSPGIRPTNSAPAAAAATEPPAPSESAAETPLHRMAALDQEYTDRIKLAAKYVLDALDGHTRAIIQPGNAAHFAAKLQRGWPYKLVIRSLMIAQMSFLLVEPMTRKDSSVSATTQEWCICLELGLLCVYAADLALSYTALGNVRFFEKRWGCMYLAVLVASFADIVMLRALAGIKLRPTRALRPMFVIAHVRGLRQQLTTILRTLPKVVDIMMYLTVIILCYALLGVRLWKEVYSNQDDEDTDGAFDDPYSAALSLFVLLTTENYPDIMLPALHHNQGLCLVYFLSYFMFVVWMIMSLFLAIVFKNYKDIHTYKVVKAHVSERRSLLTAFLILQDTGAPLDCFMWRQLVRRVRPNCSHDAAKVLFDVLDVDKDGHITVGEFLQLIELLKYRLHCITVPPAVEVHEASAWRAMLQYVAGPLKTRAGALVDSGRVALAERCVTALNAGSLIARACTIPPAWDLAAYLLNLACVAFFLVHLMGRFLAEGVANCLRFHAFDAANATLSALTFFAPQVYQYVSWIQVLKLLLVRRRLRFITRTFFKCLPIILSMLFIGFSFMYGYVVLGFELYNTTAIGALPSCSEKEANRVADSAAYSIADGHKPAPVLTAHPQDFACVREDFNFEAAGPAFLALFQIVVSNNWNDLLFPNIDATTRYSAVYFASWFVLSNFILVNLMTSLILDMYAYRMQRTKEDKVVQLKYLLQDGSTQIWTVIKSLDWRVQVMEGSAELQAMANSDMEKSIQALEREVAAHEAYHRARLNNIEHPTESSQRNSTSQIIVDNPTVPSGVLADLPRVTSDTWESPNALSRMGTYQDDDDI